MALRLVQIGSLGLKVLWHFLHFIVSVWFLARQAAYVLESCFISSGLLKRYEALNLGNLRYLAIVIESEEAHQIPKVIELLNWLATIGVKHVCLYDNEGTDAWQSPVICFSGVSGYCF